jgi:hypothetical protein
MNNEIYEDLCERVGQMKIDPWYRKSESIFLSQRINSEDDFIKLVAFAYSWMPTIPQWHCELNWPVCKTALGELEKGKEGALKKVMELIVPSINNSIVGASKVLHFAYPDKIPIIDSNVVNGWRVLFFPSGIRGKAKGQLAALPSNFGAYGSDLKQRSKHIDLYIKYSENLFEWSKTLTDVSFRDIETKLYLLGKQNTDKEK